MAEKIYDANRLRTIFIYRLLFEKTDEEHGLSFAEIAAELEKLGAPVARKAFYDDIRALIYLGADIRTDKGRHTSYRLVSRTFEPAELKLLADAVVSSRFLTPRQSEELLGKLRTLTSVHKADILQRQLFIANNSNAGNKKLMANIDILSRAAAEKRQVSFRYFDYDVNKKKVYRENTDRFRGSGSKYERSCSPYTLAWNDEKYYLVAYNPNRGKISNFRVDRMDWVRLTDEPCRPLPKSFKLAEYLDAQFSMFSGSADIVRLRFTNDLVGAVLDRFGIQTMLIPDDDTHFHINVPVRTGTTFFGWLFQFGSKAEILTENVRTEYRKALLEAAEINGETKEVIS